MFQVVSPLNDTLVFLFRPGPIRWKLWIVDLSSTLIVYFPALIVLRSLSPFSTSILKPGPTSPLSWAVFAPAVAARTAPAVATASTASVDRIIRLPPFAFPEEYGRG